MRAQQTRLWLRVVLAIAVGVVAGWPGLDQPLEAADAPTDTDTASTGFAVVSYVTVSMPKEGNEGYRVFKVEKLLTTDPATPKGALEAKVAVPWHLPDSSYAPPELIAAPPTPSTLLCEIDWRRPVTVDKQDCYLGIHMLVEIPPLDPDIQLVHESAALPALRKLRQAKDAKGFCTEFAVLAQKPQDLSLWIMAELDRHLNAHEAFFDPQQDIDLTRLLGNALNSGQVASEVEAEVARNMMAVSADTDDIAALQVSAGASFLKKVAPEVEQHVRAATILLIALNRLAPQLTDAKITATIKAYKAALPVIIDRISALAKDNKNIAAQLAGNAVEGIPDYARLVRSAREGLTPPPAPAGAEKTEPKP